MITLGQFSSSNSNSMLTNSQARCRPLIKGFMIIPLSSDMVSSLGPLVALLFRENPRDLGVIYDSLYIQTLLTDLVSHTGSSTSPNFVVPACARFSICSCLPSARKVKYHHQFIGLHPLPHTLVLQPTRFISGEHVTSAECICAYYLSFAGCKSHICKDCSISLLVDITSTLTRLGVSTRQPLPPYRHILS